MILAALLLLAAPRFSGDPEAAPRLEAPLRAALAGTEAFGPWPPGAWEVRLHVDAAAFEGATGAPGRRAAQWTGNVLHLRPWEALRRRELGPLLRHEAVHRRLWGAGLRRWEEEARCLYAETHARPPAAWPEAPAPELQERLDRALAAGTTRTQAWAYQALSAWLVGRSVPAPHTPPAPPEPPWAPAPQAQEEEVVIRWPPERLPETLVVNGRQWSRSSAWTFQEGVTLEAPSPVRRLPGQVVLRPAGRGWSLTWTTARRTWVAAAVAGELGEDAPVEARRALAAVLWAWLAAHPRGNHPDGSLCPLTHCAVVRGGASAGTLEAAASASALTAPWGWFSASLGGVALTPRQVWGGGPDRATVAPQVPEDPWATWTRTLSATQVRYLKRAVKPGLRPGQRGLSLGVSGPYPVEDLRLAAGRAFGWTTWPSNACQGESLADGTLRLTGNGLGHNVGLCLATARFQAKQGLTAEAILEAAFGPAGREPRQAGTPGEE